MNGYFRAYSNRVREASRELPERELRVYMALLSYANCEGMCWPGIAKLVGDTGINTDGIYSTLEALVAQKYIIIVRRGAHDPLTRQMLPNVYRVDGAVIDDDCVDNEFPIDDPILFPSSKQESKQHQRADSESNQSTKQPNNTSSSAEDSFEVEEGKPKPERKAKTKTPERSSIPKPPNPVPATPSPSYFNGSLKAYAEELPPALEAIAVELFEAVGHKMTIRNARFLVHSYGVEGAKSAIAHMQRQSEVYNPAGFIRFLLEKHAVETADRAAADPGRAYITGEFSDYIDH